MAKCVRESIPPEPRPMVEEVVLRMTPHEAAVLLAVTGHIIGDPSGPRGKTRAIFYALADAGVKGAYVKMDHFLKLEAG